jgi:hypothetical protein
LQTQPIVGVITTHDHGDDAHQFNGPDIDVPALREAIRDPGESHGISLDLDLSMTLKATGTEQDHSIKLWMFLDVDIYSPITWESRDNAELARLNGRGSRSSWRPSGGSSMRSSRTSTWVTTTATSTRTASTDRGRPRVS